jgi:hypothetical protein
LTGEVVPNGLAKTASVKKAAAVQQSFRLAEKWLQNCKHTAKSIPRKRSICHDQRTQKSLAF